MDTERNLGKLLRLSSFLMKKNIDNILITKEPEVTIPKGYVLCYLYQRKDLNTDTYQKDVEQEFRINKATVSDSLSYLEENDYIKRVTSKVDKRLRNIVLTDKGIYFVENFRETRSIVTSKAFEGFSENEKEELYTLLERICNNLCEGGKC